jgi:protoporphyrinogen oxidase
MAEVVIIGAGLTGLSAAYHLEQHGFYDYKLFEKESSPGGLCRSLQQDGFTFDYTGHLLHINDPYFRKFVEQTIGLHNFATIQRQSFIYSQERYTRYPYQINLQGLPPEIIVECIEEFVQRPPGKKSYSSFHDWVIASFGKGIAKHFFFPYQEKIFSYKVKQLTASWTGRFVPQTSLAQLLHGALGSYKEENIGYNAQFLYPLKGGIYYWIDKLSKKLHTTIHTSFTVDTIDTFAKKIHFTNGHSEPYNYLISTMPLDILLNCLKEKTNSAFKQAASKLVCNSIINFNIGVNRPDISEKHWIYFPEPHYPFYRLGFPHNFSPYTVPAGCSSLYGEFSYLKADQKTLSEKLKHSRQSTLQLLSLREQDIVTEKILTIPHAYVIYNRWRDKYLPSLLKALEELSLHSVGRYGAWKYSSMQEGFLDGKTIAEHLLKILEPSFISPSSVYQQLNL